MSYFEDQYEAWMDNDCQGNIEDINPDEYWGDKITDCESKGHGTIKTEKLESHKDGKEYMAKVCQSCHMVLNPK